MVIYFLFKQKTAYEMRISDWSSDVCSSDLAGLPHDPPADAHGYAQAAGGDDAQVAAAPQAGRVVAGRTCQGQFPAPDRRHHQRPEEGKARRAVLGQGLLRPARRHAQARGRRRGADPRRARSEEHTSELQSLMRNTYAVCVLKKKNKKPEQ